MMDFQFLVR